MAVPKKRLTRTRRNNRRSHHALKKINLILCPKCNESKLAHTICPNCGTYNNEQIIEFGKKDKKDIKNK